MKIRSTSQQFIEDRIRDLRENTDFVSTLFESLTGYAIIAADFDGNVIAFNEGARQIYGYTPEEVIGKQNIEIFFPEDFIAAGKLQQVIDELIGKGRFSREGEQVRKNGDTFPAQILFTLTNDSSGKVVGFVEIVEDLTERRRTEEVEAEARANAARLEQLQQEFHSLKHLTLDSPATASAQMFAVLPLSKSIPDTFNELIRRYEDALELALEQRAYKVEHNISGKMRSLSELMGSLKAGPREVVDIHSAALKNKSGGAAPQKVQAYVEEGRMMVLELMGYLASFYRSNSLATGPAAAPETTEEKTRTKEG